MAAQHEAVERTPQSPAAESGAPVDSRIRLLAREIYREFRRNGFSHRQIVMIVEEFLSQAADEIERSR